MRRKKHGEVEKRIKVHREWLTTKTGCLAERY